MIFDGSFMDRLHIILAEVVDGTQGTAEEKAETIHRAMKERQADGILMEFVSWFPGTMLDRQ